MASSSQAVRAAATLTLIVGFYALALSLAGLLLYMPYAQWQYHIRVNLKISFWCLVGAGTILWSILPRPDRFEPPGPLLNPVQHPRLFDNLTGIARATNQDMPSEVYLIPDVNAWVAERGGVAGIGSRRVMGLGLPLMQVLSVSGLRAVLAHEFGHFYGGDTRLGPWIYKTHAALARTLENLASRESLLQLPFNWYGHFFLKVTQGISRQQEHAADALAARTVGARPLAEALRTIHGAGQAFPAYFASEVVPLIDSGFRPPLAEGFQRFLQATMVAQMVSNTVERELAGGATNPYDTHPPLRERLAALRQLPEGDIPSADSPAIALLNDTDTEEKRLLAFLTSHGPTSDLKLVRWESVASEAYVPTWRAVVQRHSAALAGLTASSLSSLCDDRLTFGRKLLEKDRLLTKDQIVDMARSVLDTALAAALAEAGWELDIAPGEPVRFKHNGEVLEPFTIMTGLVSRKLKPEEWLERCQQLGISDLPLA